LKTYSRTRAIVFCEAAVTAVVIPN